MRSFEEPVRQYMSSPVHTISIQDDVQEAERRMRELKISSLAVTAGRDEHLVGVVSRTDLLALGRFRAEEQGRGAALLLGHESIGELMHRSPLSVAPQDPLSAAARRMVEHDIHRVFVTEGGRLVGVLSSRDLLLPVAESRSEVPISAFMTAPVLTIDVSAPLSAAVDLLAEERVRGLVVVEREWPVGLFTQVEALSALHEAAATPVEEVMSSALLCLPKDTPLCRAAVHMAATRARRVVAVEGRQARGVLTSIDLARAGMSPANVAPRAAACT